MEPSRSQTPAPSQQNDQAPITIDDISPALFDIVPPLERLLSRLLIPSGDGTAPVSQDEPEYKRPLDISQLDAAANPIRAKFRKLRQMIPRLPDIDRTVEEQEEEIGEIEARIERQRGMLEGLRSMIQKDLEDMKKEDNSNASKVHNGN
jgi:mediator complex subunit MED9